MPAAAPCRAILSTRSAHGRGARPAAGATPARAGTGRCPRRWCPASFKREKRANARPPTAFAALCLPHTTRGSARRARVALAAPPSLACEARPASHTAASREAGHSRPLCAMQKMALPRTPVGKSSSSVVATPAPPPQSSSSVDAQLPSFAKLLLPAHHRHARHRHRGIVHNHGWKHGNLSWCAYPEWPQRDSNPRPSAFTSGEPPLPIWGQKAGRSNPSGGSASGSQRRRRAAW